jgi:hypothetical protein
MSMPRGRPKALHTGKVTDPNQRALCNLLKDIARTKQKIKSVRELVTVLRWQPKYQRYSYETLRHDITEAMNYAKEVYRHDAMKRGAYGDLLHIIYLEPRRSLFEKTLKLLREELLTQKR